MREAVLLSAVRLPTGRFLGSLKGFTAPQLGALVVREHQELVFISVGGMVQRTAAAGISQQGRSATGVKVMNLRDEDLVSAVALVVEAAEDANGEDAAAAQSA